MKLLVSGEDRRLHRCLESTKLAESGDRQFSSPLGFEKSPFKMPA